LRSVTRDIPIMPLSLAPAAFAALAAIACSGCVIGTAAKVVTAPVRVASGAVDLATTSQSEADEKRGRALRKQEEKLGKLEREYIRLLERCREGDRRKCNEAQVVYADIQELKGSMPALPSESD
jgi:hypothetical protein